MAQVHVVRTAPFTVDSYNNRIDKNNPTTTINDLKNTHLEHLVIPDDSIPTSSGYPTIREYLEAEAAIGFTLRYMDQTFIITYLEGA